MHYKLDYKPHVYQNTAYRHVMDNPFYALFLDMGLGKTVITLSALVDLFLKGEVEKVLIIAPLRVANNVWLQESKKWYHTSFLNISIVTGSAKQREKALEKDAQIYVINRENTKWLCERYGYYLPFDMLVIDELSSFKAHDSQRFKALKAARVSFKRILGLTGTPMTNGYMDLWAQILILDGGVRLLPYISHYRKEYFTEERVGSSEYAMGYELIEGMDVVINDKISDICLSMKTEDYLDLPPFIVIDEWVQLPPDVLQMYKTFEKDKIFEMFETEVTATSAGALSGKLLQYSNGACYHVVQIDETTVERRYLTVHDYKIERLLMLIEKAAGQPVLIAYQFQSDLERLQHTIKAIFPKLKQRTIKEGNSVEDWNEGKIDVMFAHCMSAGHGLNLQFGGSIVIWFGLTWSLELYLQFNKRLHRQGITKPVTCYRIMCEDTYDDVVRRSLDEKTELQDILMEYLKQRYLA